MFTPEIWILISFLCFIAICAKKALQLFNEQTEEYAHQVENRIKEAEHLRDEAASYLAQSKARKESIERDIENYRIDSEARVKALSKRNEDHINSLISHFDASLKAKIDSNINKSIDEIIVRVAEEIEKELQNKILEIRPKVAVSRDDLDKLKGGNLFS